MRLAPLLGLGLMAAPAALAQAGPQPGSCLPGTAQADLDVNDVAARVFNTGSLFYGNDTDGTVGNRGYVVPKATGNSSVYASGIWIGGLVGTDDTPRVAAETYGPAYPFFPGPLGDDGRPVNSNDCSAFDRIYSVSRADIAATAAGNPVGDVLQWPVELGAPVVDGDGIEGNYDFAAGDRPDIVADQAVFWVMNDVGAPRATAGELALGVEVRVLAFAYDRPDALGQATFYRYTVVNKSGEDIRDAYVSVFVDPDLGDSADDYVGSDPERGLGYAYNADNQDAEYGIPPALGYDFFQGPIIPDGDDDGTDPDTLGTTAISYFINGNGNPFNDPSLASEFYNYMQGLWGDGTVMRAYGDGYAETQGDTTTFMFPGDPVTGQPWSEGVPGSGTSNSPDDRRFAVHTGPFPLASGEAQTVVFGIVYAQGTNNLNSINALRAADDLAQATFEAGFVPPPVAGEAAPEGAAALRVAPNPFTTEARVRLAEAPGTDVRATLLDVLGRQVAVVHDGPLAGDLRVSGAGLAPGVYLLRVQSDAAVRTVRLVRR